MKVKVFYWIENDGAGSANVNFTRTLEDARSDEDAADPDDQMADRTATSQIIDVGPA